VAKKKRRKATQEQKPTKTDTYSRFDRIFDSRDYFWYYAAAIGILTLILFSKFVFSGKMLFGSDTLQAGVFFRHYFVEYFKANGSVPQWNPYIFGGMPFVDAFHGDVFYPISFVFKMIFPLFRALGWVLVFHVFLAGINMYLCARVFKLNKLASSLAGLFYMFAPYLVSLVAPGHDGKMFVTALFPLTILFLERGMERRSYLDFIGLGTVIGLIILTPHPQMAYFSLWAIGSYFVFKLIVRYLKEKSLFNAGVLTGLFLVAIVVGLALSAIQFYPGYKYVKEFSPRSGEGRGGYEWATSWSMNTEELAGMVVPQFAGVSGQSENTYWGKNYFKDNSEYIGLFPLLLGALALGFFNDRRKWFFFGLGAFALVYALGGTTPVFYIFYYLIPNVKSMRAPSMIMFLFSFSFALLGAMGAQYIAQQFKSDKRGKRRKVRNVLLIASISYGALALVWTAAGEPMMRLYQSIFYSSIDSNKLAASISNIGAIQAGLWIAAVMLGIALYLLRAFENRRLGLASVALVGLLAILEVWRVDFRFIDTLDPSQRFGQHQSVPFLREVIGNDRIIDLTGRVFGSRDYYAYFGINQVAGYHGNQLAVYDRLIGGLQMANLFERTGKPKLPVLNLLGVRYLVYQAGYPSPDPALSKVFDQYGVTIYMNRSSLPRAFIAHEYRVANADSILSLVENPRFNPEMYMLLEEEPEFRPSKPLLAANEECDIIEYESDYVKVVTMLKEPAFVCLTDSYYPAWKAYIDGEQTEVYRAYSALRAVGVPEGEHTIEFVYKSETYKASKMVTYLTIVFIGLSCVGGIVRSRLQRGRKDG
jgi:hypothetical protein